MHVQKRENQRSFASRERNPRPLVTLSALLLTSPSRALSSSAAMPNSPSSSIAAAKPQKAKTRDSTYTFAETYELYSTPTNFLLFMLLCADAACLSLSSASQMSNCIMHAANLHARAARQMAGRLERIFCKIRHGDARLRAPNNSREKG